MTAAAFLLALAAQLAGAALALVASVAVAAADARDFARLSARWPSLAPPSLDALRAVLGAWAIIGFATFVAATHAVTHGLAS